MTNGAARRGLFTEHIEAATDIAAPPERVWAVLADLARYPDWNPFIRRIEGPLRVGGRLTVRIEPPGGRGMTFRPNLLAVEPGRRLRWRGRLLVPGLFDGEHGFRLEPGGAGTRLLQEEDFRGPLLPLFGAAMLERTRRGFEAMNAALKRRAEGAG